MSWYDISSTLTITVHEHYDDTATAHVFLKGTGPLTAKGDTRREAVERMLDGLDALGVLDPVVQAEQEAS